MFSLDVKSLTTVLNLVGLKVSLLTKVCMCETQLYSISSTKAWYFKRNREQEHSIEEDTEGVEDSHTKGGVGEGDKHVGA
jgi:hypothetical protein